LQQDNFAFDGVIGESFAIERLGAKPRRALRAAQRRKHGQKCQCQHAKEDFPGNELSGWHTAKYTTSDVGLVELGRVTDTFMTLDLLRLHVS